MAKWRALRDGDVLQADLIENRLTSKPSMKGIALSSDSIEDYEKFRAQHQAGQEDVGVD